MFLPAFGTDALDRRFDTSSEILFDKIIPADLALHQSHTLTSMIMFR